MNQSDTTTTSPCADPDSQKHLLVAIKDLRTCVGDGLNDDEFTHFLLKTGLPSEYGFEFLSYSNRFVTLSVPKQDKASWYREKGWVIEEKEQRAREIAEKWGLSLYHPPDAVGTHNVTPQSEASHPCHHLEMSHNRETLIVVHPYYLKVRLFPAAGGTHHGWSTHRCPTLGPPLLKDLAGLYEH